MGAEAVARLADLFGARLRFSSARSAWTAKIEVPGSNGPVILARPDAFMNACGPIIARLAGQSRKTPPLVVYDDMDLELGVLRFRTKGSAGGHRGLASVISSLGTSAFPRLKIGIGRPDTKEEVIDYVLDRFDEQEASLCEKTLDRAAAALRTVLIHGLERAMTEYSA